MGNVVSIYGNCKPNPLNLDDLPKACAAAALLRKSGVKVEVVQEDDNKFTIERVA